MLNEQLMKDTPSIHLERTQRRLDQVRMHAYMHTHKQEKNQCRMFMHADTYKLILQALAQLNNLRVDVQAEERVLEDFEMSVLAFEKMMKYLVCEVEVLRYAQEQVRAPHSHECTSGMRR